MAEGGRREVSVFWSQDNSDEDQRVAYVPGLCTEGNLRSASKFKGVKSEERKARAVPPVPETTMDPILDWTQHTVMQGARTDAGSRSASLKDLCPEDKRRIANLIKELARVSEEKEVTEERLKSEHESFEKKIRHLEQQNELIATEREALQQQYRECQEMLSLYQKYLSEQQDKLSRSLSDLGAGSIQTHQVPKTSRQPKAHELNGSYIAPCNKQSSECESLCSVAAPLCCRTESGCGLQCHPDRYTLDSCIRRKCCGSDTAEVRYQDATCGQHCSSALDQPLPRCCLHRPTLSAQRRAQPELSLARHPQDCSFSSISATSGLSNGVPTRAKGSAMSEQRKHELLLQKMELEVEKERLQQLLEQHEAKLLEKQQELLQTKIESERHPLVIQTREVAVTTTPSLGAVPKSNGSLCSPVRPLSVGLPTPPSSKNGKVRSADGTRSGKKVAEPNDSKSLIPPQSSVCKGSRRDATTSPSVPSLRKVMDNGKMSPEQRDLCRYETSLIDMLDAISPISSQKECRRYKDPYDLCILSPPNHGYSKPSRKPVQPARREAPSMDLEESRMLEEIFFIC